MKQATPWPSPGAQRWPARFADIALQSFAVARKNSAFDDIWLGQFTAPRFNLIFRERNTNGGTSRPLIGAGHNPGSIGVGWPVEPDAAGPNSVFVVTCVLGTFGCPMS